MSPAGRLSVALGTVVAVGCGSIDPSFLVASAREEYPHCHDVRIAERADGVRQWLVVCGERRLFGLRSDEDIARSRARLGLRDGEEFHAILRDQSGPIRWGAAHRVDDASTSTVVASLRPLRVEVTMLRVGGQTSYIAVASPHRRRCETAPELYVGGQPVALASAQTETVVESTHLFARRIDLSTLRLIASTPFEISYCGRRHALDDETADVFRAWAADPVAAGPPVPARPVRRTARTGTPLLYRPPR